MAKIWRQRRKLPKLRRALTYANPLLQTQKAFKRSKTLRKTALIAAGGAAAFFGGPYVIAAAKGIGATAGGAASGVVGFAKQFYGGATGAKAGQTASAGYTQNDTGGGSGYVEESSPVAQAFFNSGGSPDVGDGSRRSLAGPAGLASVAGGCAGPASAEYASVLTFNDAWMLAAYCAVLLVPAVSIGVYEWIRIRARSERV